MSNGKAPTCPISRSQALPGMRPPEMAIPPRANDLQSAISALNQMALLLNPGVNSGQSTGSSIGESASFPGNPVNNPKQDDGGPKKKQRWVEEDRGLVKVTVHNPDDRNIFIEFPQINRLLYEERKTQVKFKWYL